MEEEDVASSGSKLEWHANWPLASQSKARSGKCPARSPLVYPHCALSDPPCLSERSDKESEGDLSLNCKKRITVLCNGLACAQTDPERDYEALLQASGAATHRR